MSAYAKPRRHLWLYVIALVASLGGLLSGYDMGVISGALIFINETWQMSSLAQGWLVSSAIVGSVIGAAANGILADIYGRRKIIIATALIFALGSVMCAYAPTAGWLIASRIVIGIAVGMVTFVVPLYLSEISPQKIRPKITAPSGYLLTQTFPSIFPSNPPPPPHSILRLRIVRYVRPYQLVLPSLTHQTGRLRPSLPHGGSDYYRIVLQRNVYDGIQLQFQFFQNRSRDNQSLAISYSDHCRFHNTNLFDYKTKIYSILGFTKPGADF